MADATALAGDIASGRITAVDAMEAALAAAKAHGGLGALARVEPELGRAGARAADAAPKEGRGPFHGVPFLGKDLGSYARGMTPRAGSPALAARLADAEDDSALFARFRGAGLVPFGLTTVPEFGLSLASEPPGVPPAKNPYDLARTPGGSSGGAAAAVAAGIVPMAHATDAAGSIRVPAACCGLWGLKPSRGAVPQGPLYTNHLMGIAAEGVLARSLRDVRTAYLQASAQSESTDRIPTEYRRDADSAKIAICKAPLNDQANSAALSAAAAQLEGAGFTLCERPAPDALGAECHALAGQVLCLSLAAWLGSLNINASEVSPVIADAAERGAAMSGTCAFGLSRDIARLSGDIDAAFFAGCDAVLMPVLSGQPPELGYFDASETAAKRLAKMEEMAPNAAIANIAGLPALALPWGMSGGLPVGLQLVGPVGRDLRLMDIAARLAPPPMPAPEAVS